MITTASGFFGKYRFLSNFHPVEIVFDGWSYPSVEHAYQASKTLDEKERLSVRYKLDKNGDILGYTTPGQAKQAGKKVTLRENWDIIKLSMMEQFVRQKFTQHEDLRKALIDTGNIMLIEHNTWNDTYWGVCRGKGHNHLGRILMMIRSEQPEWKAQYGSK